MRDLFEEIWSNIRRNKLRIALTGFAVAWGIFMLIFLLGAGNGLIHALESNNSDYMTNTMNVWGGYTSKPYNGMREGRRIDLNDKDIDITLGPDFADNVEKAGTILTQASLTTSYGKEYIVKQVSGVSPEYSEMNKLSLLYGRFINEIDIKERRRVIVMDSNDARELLGVTGEKEEGLTALQKAAAAEALVGKYVKINSSMFQVIGILRPNENGWSSLYAPITTIRTIYNRGKDIDEYTFSFHGLDTEEDNRAFEDRLRASLNNNHNAAPGRQEGCGNMESPDNEHGDEQRNVNDQDSALDHWNPDTVERNRWGLQHHADLRQGADTRVRDPQGDRREPVGHTETDHFRKHHHHRVLRLRRNGARSSGQRVARSYFRKYGDGLRAFPADGL